MPTAMPLQALFVMCIVVGDAAHSSVEVYPASAKPAVALTGNLPVDPVNSVRIVVSSHPLSWQTWWCSSYWRHKSR